MGIDSVGSEDPEPGVEVPSMKVQLLLRARLLRPQLAMLLVPIPPLAVGVKVIKADKGKQGARVSLGVRVKQEERVKLVGRGKLEEKVKLVRKGKPEVKAKRGVKVRQVERERQEGRPVERVKVGKELVILLLAVMAVRKVEITGELKPEETAVTTAMAETTVTTATMAITVTMVAMAAGAKMRGIAKTQRTTGKSSVSLPL